MDKVLKLENGQYDLIETVSYPNGGASYFYVRDQQAIIIDDGICNYKKDEKPFSYSLITDKQNTYMNKYAKVYRFLKEDMGIINEVITLPCKKEEIPIKYVANREDHADASPLEIDFENNFASVYGRNSLKYLQKEYGILDEQGNNYFLDYLLRTKHGDYAVEENGVTYHHPQQIGLERYRRQLQKQNTCTEWGIKLYRFSSEDCRFENRIEDDIKTFFGENTDEFEENGLLADRPVKLYEHQENTLEEIQKQRAVGINTFLVVFPTASGKSRIVEEDLRIFSRKNTQFHALIMAPNTNIIADWRQRVKKSLPDLQEQIEICSFAYMMRNYQKYAQEKYNYIVVDEFHHAVNNPYRKITEYFEPKFLLGLTATPERMDGKDIYEICDYNVPYELPLADAINKGMLVPFHYYGIYDETDYSALHVVKGKYDSAELNETYIGNVRRHDLIYKYYCKYGSRRALGFCCTREHAEEMAKEFCKRGIPSVAVYSNANGEFSEDRDVAIDKLKRGDIRVIFSVDMFNEGVDVPSVDMVMFLRPTESPTIFLQQLGRGLRKSKGKEYLNVLDFIGNYLKAGRVRYLLTGKKLSGNGMYDPADHADYPDDCIIDFDMRLIDLFAEMDKRHLHIKDRIRNEYFRIKELLDKRPSRMDLFTYMDDEVYQMAIGHAADNPFKRYLDFLYDMNELTIEEETLHGGIGREFISLIENTNMSKVYKMPVLMAFYNHGNVRMPVTEEDLLISWKEFFNTGTNWKDLDKGITYHDFLAISDKEHVKKIMQMPVHFLLKSGNGFFVEKAGAALALRDDLQEIIADPAFVEHMKDAIEYRTMDYYQRRYRENMKNF